MVQTKSQYPPGRTFLDTMKRSFVDVPVDKSKDNAITTSEFLEAAESLTTLFGMSIRPSQTSEQASSLYLQYCVLLRALALPTNHDNIRPRLRRLQTPKIRHDRQHQETPRQTTRQTPRKRNPPSPYNLRTQRRLTQSRRRSPLAKPHPGLHIQSDIPKPQQPF